MIKPYGKERSIYIIVVIKPYGKETSIYINVMIKPHGKETRIYKVMIKPTVKRRV